MVHIYHIFFILSGEGNGNPLQYSCLENPMDRGAWWATVHRVTKSRTQLNDFTFTFHSQASEKEMAIHSSILAWRIPRTEEPGGPSMGSHRVGRDWSNLAAAAGTKKALRDKILWFLLDKTQEILSLNDPGTTEIKKLWKGRKGEEVNCKESSSLCSRTVGSLSHQHSLELPR